MNGKCQHEWEKRLEATWLTSHRDGQLGTGSVLYTTQFGHCKIAENNGPFKFSFMNQKLAAWDWHTIGMKVIIIDVGFAEMGGGLLCIVWPGLNSTKELGKVMGQLGMYGRCQASKTGIRQDTPV